MRSYNACYNSRSPVDHNSAYAADEYRERCSPDETSSWPRAASRAPSCSDGPAYAHPPCWWQNSPSTGPDRDPAATRNWPKYDQAGRCRDTERGLDADVPRWPDAASSDEADALHLNQPLARRRLVRVEPASSGQPIMSASIGIMRFVIEITKSRKKIFAYERYIFNMRLRLIVVSSIPGDSPHLYQQVKLL